jgi:hypothetical protein
MDANHREAKRLKISDWLVIAGGRNKVILKNPKADRHLTIQVNERGIIDVHMTEETKPKKYEPILRRDQKELEKQLIKKLVEIIGKSRVNLNYPVLDGCILAIPPKDLEDRFRRMMVSKGKDIVLPKEVLEEKWKEMRKDFLFIKPQDAEEIAFTKSYVLDRNGKIVGGLNKIQKNYFFISLEVLDSISRVLGATSFDELQDQLT